jgi:hypothetical protein
MPTGKYRAGYTGFIGLVDDFVGFNEYFDADSSLGISKLFIKTGQEIVTLNITGVSYNVIKSGFLNPTGILGTGITGYQVVPSEEIINAECGDTCVIYVKSGITGLITGEKIQYAIVNQEGYSVSQEDTIYNLYDEDYASRFTKNYIVFNQKLDSNDLFNINLYKDVNAIVDKPIFSLLNNVYISAADDLTEENILIFFNGVNIASNEYQISSSEDKFTISKYNKDSNDLILYTLSSRKDFKNKVYIGNTNIALTGITSDKYNLFLNGQRLISGYNYTQYLSGVNFVQAVNFTNTSVDNNDQIYVKEDDYYISITGSNIKTYNPDYNYNNEKIWLNGIFQSKIQDYILTSCYNEMMKPTEDIDTKNESIFNNEYFRFNL